MNKYRKQDVIRNKHDTTFKRQITIKYEINKKRTQRLDKVNK